TKPSSPHTRTTLLPYTTLFRSSEAMYARVGNVSEAMALCQEGCAYACQHAVLTAYLRQLPQEASPALARLCPKDQLGDGRTYWRSEENTSELQSRGHLVCRLLL